MKNDGKEKCVMTSFLSKISRKKPFISSMGFVIVFVFAIMVPVESVISLVNDTQTNGYIIGTIQQTLVGVLVLWLWNNLDMDCKIGMQNGWKQAWFCGYYRKHQGD